MIDCNEYWQEDIFDKTPVYEELASRELDKAFQGEFDFLRKVIVPNDYDDSLVFIETRFQYVLSNKSELCRFFKRERAAYKKFREEYGEDVD